MQGWQSGLSLFLSHRLSLCLLHTHTLTHSLSHTHTALTFALLLTAMFSLPACSSVFPGSHHPDTYWAQHKESFSYPIILPKLPWQWSWDCPGTFSCPWTCCCAQKNEIPLSCVWDSFSLLKPGALGVLWIGWSVTKEEEAACRTKARKSLYM